MSKSGRLWQYGDYWIAAAHGTPKLYAYWYDERRRKTARRSLGTEVLSEAQDRLIEIAGTAKADGGRSPDRVLIMSSLDHYYENDVKAKPSADQAFRAITLVQVFLAEKLGTTAVVSAFGPIR